MTANPLTLSSHNLPTDRAKELFKSNALKKQNMF